MPKYKYVHPVTGQRLVLQGAEEPTDAEVEQAFNDVNNYRSRTNNLISSRPNLWEKLGKELSPETDPFKDPNASMLQKLGGSYGKMARLGLFGMGAPAQSVEGAIAAPVLTMQRGEFDPRKVGKAALMGATGEYPAEFGDVLNELGAPEGVNQIGGLAAMGFIPGPAQLAKLAGKGRVAAVKALGNAADVVGERGSNVVAALGRLEPGAVAYGRKTGFKSVNALDTAETAVETLVDAENRAAAMAGTLRKKASTEFGDAIKPFATESFDLYTPAGIKTGENTAQRLLDEGLATIKKGKLVAATEAGDIPQIVALVNKINSKTAMTGNELRRILFELRELRGSKSQGLPFIVDLDQNIRSTLTQKPALKDADALYSSRIRLLEGDTRAGTPGLENITDISTRTGRAPIMENILGQNPAAARQRQVLESGEQMVPELAGTTDNLYNAALANAFKSFRPKTTLSLAGAGVAAWQAFQGNPALALGATIAASQLSPKGYALTHKALNIARNKAIQLRSTPIVDKAMELVERGVVDPGLVRQLTGRNE